MGLFSKRQDDRAKAPARAQPPAAVEPFTHRRHFFLPYDQATVSALIAAWPDIELFDEAPIVETVYFSEATSQRIVFTAGNRLVTHWNIIVELRPHDGGTKGTVYVDRTHEQVQKWWGNIMSIIPDMYRRLQSATATFTDWDIDDVFDQS